MRKEFPLLEDGTEIFFRLLAEEYKRTILEQRRIIESLRALLTNTPEVEIPDSRWERLCLANDAQRKGNGHATI